LNSGTQRFQTYLCSLLSALTALKALYLTATKVTREQVNRLKKALAAAGNTEVEVEF